KTVFWSFAYEDWNDKCQMSLETAKKKILDNIHNGAVILLHPTSDINAQILGDVIDELKSKGYSFGSLDQLTNGCS
ncbi:MAG: delta-lactam-biosynthetic de-N-acetylase, partial [Clostridia bacterium]|nr:delta-lactam-biosynthetic de-N-acetylase [Clostridia bacterium]